MSVLHSFFRLNYIPLYDRMDHRYWSAHQLLDSWVLSIFWLLWIMLLWTFMFTYCIDIFFFLLGIFLGVACYVMQHLYVFFWQNYQNLVWLTIQIIYPFQISPLLLEQAKLWLCYLEVRRVTLTGIFWFSLMWGSWWGLRIPVPQVSVPLCCLKPQ